MNRDEAVLMRDLAVECLARVNRITNAVHDHGSRRYWDSIRLSIGRCMGEIATAMNVVEAEYPDLELSEEAHIAIAIDRFPLDEQEIVAAASSFEELRPSLNRLERSLRELDAAIGQPRHKWLKDDWAYPALREALARPWREGEDG